MVNSQDVAKQANVSQATVSRAFRDDTRISPETKRKVIKAAEDLGYYPNYSARGLKQKKSRIIGIMMSDADNIFYNALIKQLERSLVAKGYRLLLSYNDEDPRRERECLESMLSSRVEGVFCIPVSTENEDLYSIMKKNNIHIVQIIRILFPGFDAVTINDEMGAYMATNHLLSQGHKNILMTEYSFNELHPVKTAGYLRALNENGLTDDCARILDLSYNVDNSALIAGAMINGNCTAIITSNTIMTINALKAIKSQGLSIPEDISVIAYDDNAWLEFLGVSAITHPMEEIGKAMSELLIGRIEKDSRLPEPQAQIKIKPFLLLRNSIKKIT